MKLGINDILVSYMYKREKEKKEWDRDCVTVDYKFEIMTNKLCQQIIMSWITHDNITLYI